MSGVKNESIEPCYTRNLRVISQSFSVDLQDADQKKVENTMIYDSNVPSFCCLVNVTIAAIDLCGRRGECESCLGMYGMGRTKFMGKYREIGPLTSLVPPCTILITSTLLLFLFHFSFPVQYSSLHISRCFLPLIVRLTFPLTRYSTSNLDFPFSILAIVHISSLFVPDL